MRRICFIVLLIAVAGTTHSQQLSQDSIRKSKIEYYFQVQSGALIGCGSCSDAGSLSFSGATTHGIKLGKRLRVGGGMGFDSYTYWNIVPVSGSVNYDLLGKKNAVFVELNYGDAIVARRQLNYEEYGYKDSKGGKMYSYGLGYRIKYDNVRISVGVGRKTQLVTYYYEYPTTTWQNGRSVQGDPSRKTIKSEMNRFMIWMAVGWK